MAMGQKNILIDAKVHGFVIKKKDFSKLFCFLVNFCTRAITQMILSMAKAYNIAQMVQYCMMGNGKRVKSMGWALKLPQKEKQKEVNGLEEGESDGLNDFILIYFNNNFNYFKRKQITKNGSKANSMIKAKNDCIYMIL